MVTLSILALMASAPGRSLPSSPLWFGQITADVMLNSMRRPLASTERANKVRVVRIFVSDAARNRRRLAKLEAELKAMKDDMAAQKREYDRKIALLGSHQGPGGKPIQPGRPPVPPIVTMNTVLKFVNPKGEPVNQLNVHVDAYSAKTGKLIWAKDDVTSTQDPGTLTLKLKEFPVRLNYSVMDKDGWSIREDVAEHVNIDGTEGVVALSDGSSSVSTAMLASKPGERGMALAQGGKKPPKKKPQERKTTAKPPEKAKLIEKRYEVPPIVVERSLADVQFHGDPGTKVTLGGTSCATLDDAGNAKVSMHAALAGEGAELELRRQVGGFVFTGTAPLKSLDPYATNDVKLPVLPLTSVDKIDIPVFDCRRIGWMTGPEAIEALGKPEKIDNPVKDSVDPFYVWHYKKKGMDLRVRTVGGDSKKPIQMVERVDLLSPDGGKFADVAVDDPYESIQKQLGMGEPVEAEQLGQGIFTSYLNRGVVFCNNASKVTSIQVRRSTELMLKGLDFDQPAYRVAIYVPQVEAGGTVTGNQVQEVREAFRNLAGLRFVDNREEADFELRLKVENMEHKVAQVIGAIPYKAESSATLSYELFDLAAQKTALDLSGRPIQATVTGKSKADYERDVERGALMITAAELAAGLIKDPIKRSAAQLAIGALGGLSAVKMKEVMSRAVERTKDLSLQDAVGKVSEAVEEAIGAPARVLAVDRRAGTVTLNLGSTQGIQPGTVFRLINGSTILGEEKHSALSERYVLARAETVEPGRTVCKVSRVVRRVSHRAELEEHEEPATEELKQLLDPDTGVVTARIRIGTKSDSASGVAGAAGGL